jgi:hypothetical protein
MDGNGRNGNLSTAEGERWAFQPVGIEQFAAAAGSA